MRYIWVCEACFFELEIDRPVKDYQLPPDDDCPACKGGQWKKKIVMPGITRASYVDGTKRKGFQDLKEIAKLEMKRASANTESERKEAGKAIADLKKIKP